MRRAVKGLLLPVLVIIIVTLDTKFTINGFHRAMRMYSADYVVARCLPVCLSVCHTPIYCVETAKYIIKLISPSGNHTSLFFVSNVVAIVRR